MRRARKLSYANVMSTIAVFVALGGASYAVVAIPNNSVGTQQVKDRSLGVVDLSRKAVRSLRGKAGARGAPGATGPVGTNGTNGLKGEKGDTGDVAKWASAIVATDESITTPINLPYDAANGSGPSVTVNVPASGLVEVYARVHIKNDANGFGQVGLQIDGAPAKACGTDGGLLNSQEGDDLDFATGTTNTCYANLPGGPVIITTTPGTHTFTLVYKILHDSGHPDTTVHFSDRRLYVAPRP